jgi:hypothetical protein
MVADPVRVVSELPEGWLPQAPVIVTAFARPCDGVWEVLFPEWTIVGRAGELREALDQAAEMLEDYWRMCASEGRTFSDSKRPVMTMWFARLLLRTATGAALSHVRDSARRRLQLLRFPVESGAPKLAV